MTEAFADIDLSVAPPRVTFPRLYNAVVDLVDRHLTAGRGGRLAYRDDREAVTYAELAQRIDRAGRALQALGVAMEERVLLVMLDSIDFVAVFLGAIKIGAVPVPVNTLLTTADYALIGRDCRARLAVVSDALLERAGPALPHAQVIVAGKPDGLAALLAAASPAPLPAAPTTSDDVAFWLYSSGTTGAPKAAMHLHRHLMLTAALYAQGVLGIREDDVVFSAAKLFFAYGLGNALTFPLSVGAQAVLMAERSAPAAVTRAMHAYQPTIFCGVPTLFAALLADRNFGPTTASAALRVCTSAGEALPSHIGEAWRARFGSDILDGLGSTEMLHIFLSNRPGEVRYGTTGKPVPGYELKLAGDDGDADEGALWVSGPTAAIGYFNQRERSLATFHGPWTRTGDRYARDAEGYYTYAGRTDDMLKVGGIWVSPFEVESALAAHEAVLEAAVVGHLDEDGLIKPKAFVVLKDAARAGDALAAELKAHVKTRLAPFKYPRIIEFVGELPKTATGKIQRFKLRAASERRRD